jgi:hypothetical protein
LVLKEAEKSIPTKKKIKIKINGNSTWLIITCIAHISIIIECSWRLADVLACSQKVSHPEMRLVSAANLTHHSHFPFWETLNKKFKFKLKSLLRNLVHAGFCMFPQSCDFRPETAGSIFIVRAWCSECAHTLDLGLSSNPKDVGVTLIVLRQQLVHTVPATPPPPRFP